MTVPNEKRLRDMETENAQLNKLLPESMLDAAAVESRLRPNALSPQGER